MTATIRYMGSKRALAPMIRGVIDSVDPGAVVADAFAGTCAVASAAASTHAVVTNDIHHFAAVVARALLTGPISVPSPATATADLAEAYRVNLRALNDVVAARVVTERRHVKDARSGQKWQGLKEFTEAELAQGAPMILDGLAPYTTYSANPTSTPYSLFSTLFASSYVGVEQAVEIDSLRFAISQAPAERADLYLLALLQALSHCAAAPGHFAQYLVPRDKRNTQYIARMRQRSVVERFFNALADIRLPSTPFRNDNVVCRMEATNFVRTLPQFVNGELIIYADPPYSRAQYSRYYHVLETLVRYDYPNASGKGRYRADRFNTGFSRTGGVRAAMDEFVAAAAATGAPLLLSYPRNGLMTGEDVLEVLNAHYPTVTIPATAPLDHSTMGGAPGTSHLRVVEDLYYARWE